MPSKVIALDTAQTFVDVIQRLYAEQFTGYTGIHWAQGHPQEVEFPQEPKRIILKRDAGSGQT